MTRKGLRRGMSTRLIGTESNLLHNMGCNQKKNSFSKKYIFRPILMTYMSNHPIFDRKTEKIKKKIGHSSLSKIMGRLLWDCLRYLIFFFVFFSAIQSKIGQYGHVNQTEISQKNMSKKKKRFRVAPHPVHRAKLIGSAQWKLWALRIGPISTRGLTG